MWLLNTRTLLLKDFVANPPPYAILSHTWGDAEVSHKDLRAGPSVYESKKGFQKILYTCQQARKDGLDWCWIDTCCIDKTSSAELSEAINSMFRWYERSRICYALLSDVDGAIGEIDPVHDVRALQAFARSRWFQRGWTLQELIAPSKVAFYGTRWNFLGTREGTLLDTIIQITGIDKEILVEWLVDFSRLEMLDSISIGRKLSWAAARKTTRKEDEAYCLLGIFRVSMPLLYGEAEKAFIRLQQEILKTSTDHTIFAWDFPRRRRVIRVRATGGLLAPDLSFFADSGDARRYSYAANVAFEVVSGGLRAHLPLVKPAHQADADRGSRLAVLSCFRAADPGLLLAVELEQARSKTADSIAEFSEARGSTSRLHTIAEGDAAASICETILIRDRTAYPLEGRFRHSWLRFPAQHLYVAERSPSMPAAVSEAPFLRVDYPLYRDKTMICFGHLVSGRKIAVSFEGSTEYWMVLVSLQVYTDEQGMSTSCVSHTLSGFNGPRTGKKVASANVDSALRVTLMCSRENILGHVVDVWELVVADIEPNETQRVVATLEPNGCGEVVADGDELA